MKALLVSYDLKKANINQKTLIQQTLYGYTDYSNHGQYKYKRKGLLNKYPNIKINRGVFIINANDRNKIIPLLKKNNASLTELSVVISKSKLKTR